MSTKTYRFRKNCLVVIGLLLECLCLSLEGGCGVLANLFLNTLDKLAGPGRELRRLGNLEGGEMTQQNFLHVRLCVTLQAFEVHDRDLKLKKKLVKWLISRMEFTVWTKASKQAMSKLFAHCTVYLKEDFYSLIQIHYFIEHSLLALLKILLESMNLRKAIKKDLLRHLISIF